MEERKSCRPSFLVPMYLIKGGIIEKTELWIRTNADQLQFSIEKKVYVSLYICKFFGCTMKVTEQGSLTKMMHG